jgi:D-amino-acid dehydrogenase
MKPVDVVVIGAGVVGLSVALAAQARGFVVRVVEREGICAGASAGNAGAFAFSDILPLASPRIIRQAPRWLLDPLGPLSVPPRYALKIAPWMLRFWRASWPARVRASTTAQTSLMALSKAALEPFLAEHGLTSMLRKDGQLQVYEGQAEFDASLPGWATRAQAGIVFEHLTGDGIAARQPGLAARFTHATFTPGWWSISDPNDYVLALSDCFRAKGGEVEIAEATHLLPDGVDTSAGMMKGRVVLAAGAFSHHLARTAGVNIPLETERGYNTTLPSDAIDLRCQITFGGHGFVIARVASGIRVGGAVELGGLRLPPNYARADAMLTRAKQFMPNGWGFVRLCPTACPRLALCPTSPTRSAPLGMAIWA